MDRSEIDSMTEVKLVNGVARILVEKRSYKPAGWKELRNFTLPARITPKRIYTSLSLSGHVFDRATGQEIQNVETRINQSIRYSIAEWKYTDLVKS